jgi:hypothetical protein
MRVFLLLTHFALPLSFLLDCAMYSFSTQIQLATQVYALHLSIVLCAKTTVLSPRLNRVFWVD